MIHGQHRISDVILRGLSSQPGVGSARWKSDLVDPHSLQYPVTKLLPNKWPSKWKPFNFERFESTLTVNNSWWLWNPKIPQFDQCPARLRLATKGFLHMSSSLCQFRQEILTSKVSHACVMKRKTQGSVCHSDSMGEKTKQIGYTSGRYGSTFPIQLVPFDLQPL